MGVDVKVTPRVTPFFDQDTNSFSYVVRDPTSTTCAVIDPVLNFDYASGSVNYDNADDIIDFVSKHELTVAWIIETHVHADHLSAAPYLQKIIGGKIAIGEHIVIVQENFSRVFNTGVEFPHDGSQFDHLFSDGEVYQVGNLQAKAIHTPGHTPACMAHIIGDACFVGDTLFMPDAGTARADFPGGNAADLYDSAQKILSLPGNTRLFMCHDYCPNDRNLEYQTTVAEQRQNNIHVKTGISKEDFVTLRRNRDKTLGMPRLILPSLQVNMRAGHFPEPEANGFSYLKIPINWFNQ